MLCLEERDEVRLNRLGAGVGAGGTVRRRLYRYDAPDGALMAARSLCAKLY